MTSGARLLVLGGSWFLGRAVVTEALERGWSVTTFRRGRTGVDVPGVATVRGDRTSPADLARLASAGPWDLVVDTAGYVPREQGAIARALAPVADRFAFVSSVSAYVDWPLKPLTEASPVLECPADADGDYGYDGDPGPSVYGFTKAGCERALLEVFGVERTRGYGLTPETAGWSTCTALASKLPRSRQAGQLLGSRALCRSLPSCELAKACGGE
jgi:2'-hydroxyisoflavone reductase